MIKIPYSHIQTVWPEELIFVMTQEENAEWRHLDLNFCHEHAPQEMLELNFIGRKVVAKHDASGEFGAGDGKLYMEFFSDPPLVIEFNHPSLVMYMRTKLRRQGWESVNINNPQDGVYRPPTPKPEATTEGEGAAKADNASDASSEETNDAQPEAPASQTDTEANTNEE